MPEIVLWTGGGARSLCRACRSSQAHLTNSTATPTGLSSGSEAGLAAVVSACGAIAWTYGVSHSTIFRMANLPAE
jgi:hypothetical protein